SDVHYELELVVKISRLGKYVQEDHAHKYYEEMSIGIDFTARDVQAKLKEKGHPWEKAKAFDGSAVLGKRFIHKSELQTPIEFHLTKNGETVQNGESSDMIFTIDKIISHVSQFMTLKMGDLIFTGTPAGVGPVNPGDQLKGYLEGEELLKVDVK
ncbi:MAG: fumarylacetoacetate hydrolase family protein, partial [Bacteroidota bacterium]